MPDTESVSCMCAVKSASDSWVFPDTSRRTLPTFRLITRKTGRIASDSTVSLQSRITITTTVEITVATLDSTLEAVSVSTACTPPTSLDNRDWISPVRVEVKKRRDMC
jgi:hypothetical protein